MRSCDCYDEGRDARRWSSYPQNPHDRYGDYDERRCAEEFDAGVRAQERLYEERQQEEEREARRLHERAMEARRAEEDAHWEAMNAQHQEEPLYPLPPMPEPKS